MKIYYYVLSVAGVECLKLISYHFRLVIPEYMYSPFVEKMVFQLMQHPFHDRTLYRRVAFDHRLGPISLGFC